MTEVVQIEDRDAVQIIAINRPEVRNAISLGVLLELRKAVRASAKAAHLRSIVLTGRGGAFSGGADVKEWAEIAAGKNPYPDHDWVDEAMQLVHDVFRLPKPTIAMMDGPAVGAGLDLALACDFRIASSRAKVICAYTRVGYPPDCGGSWLLPRLIGIEAAKMFVYTGESWDAARAKSIGMLTEVVPESELEERTMNLAEKLARGPTVAQGFAKQLIDSAHRRTFAEQLSEEQRAGKICGLTADHAEGLAAANEKRPARFVGR
jgi:2-(1,2-epoxy-1,2-dihydrophenyl)acetyl-CoA isomerase